jgi:hypothetical protein
MRQVSKGLLTVAATGGVLAVTSGLAYADAGASGTADSRGVASGNTVQAPVSAPVNVCGNTVNVLGRLKAASGGKCVNVSGRHGGGSSTGAVGEGSSGVGSGNVVQAPVSAPVNVCGNTVNVGGSVDQASGGDCAHAPGGHGGGSGDQQGGSSTGGVAEGSSGVGSGNVIQAPVSAPVNVCGNDVNVGGSGDRGAGSTCGNDEAPGHNPPGQPGGPQQPGNPDHPAKPHQPSTPHRPGKGQKHPSSTSPEELAETGAGSLGMAASASAGLLLGGAVLYQRSRVGARV